MKKVKCKSKYYITSNIICFLIIFCKISKINQPKSINELKKGGSQGTGEWKQSFCSCCDLGCGECLYATCCPCIYVVSVSNEAGLPEWGWFSLLTALLFGTYVPFHVVRQNVREQNGIDGSCWKDVFAAFCCRKYIIITYSFTY